jgi:hypothetical protein
MQFFKKKKPKNWKLTIADLMKEMEEGIRSSLGSPEIEWAREYEQSLIPPNYRFPRKGDLYEAKECFEINYMTAWQAPYTGSGTSKIEKGEQIWIDSEPGNPKPISTYALPVNYAELESRMVPATERDDPKFGGFYFHITTTTLNEKFNLVETGFSKDKYS